MNFNILKTVGALFLSIAILTGCSGSEPAVPKAPKSPAAAVNQVFQAISQYKPEAVWDALPKSYQSDLQAVIKKAANGNDKDQTVRIFSLLKRVVAAVKQKRGLILSLLPDSKRGQVQGIYDPALELSEAIVNSDLFDYAKLQNADVRAFLIKDGAKIMKLAIAINPKFQRRFAMMSKLSVKEVSVKDGEAVLSLIVNGKSQSNKKFTIVEGRWIPLDLKVGWVAFITKVNSELDKTIARSAKTKEMVNAMILPAIEKVVGEFEKVKTKEDMAKFMVKVQGMARSMGIGKSKGRGMGMGG